MGLNIFTKRSILGVCINVGQIRKGKSTNLQHNTGHSFHIIVFTAAVMYFQDGTCQTDINSMYIYLCIDVSLKRAVCRRNVYEGPRLLSKLITLLYVYSGT
jgi:hypothetical protein